MLEFYLEAAQTEHNMKNSFIHCDFTAAVDSSENDKITCFKGEWAKEGQQNELGSLRRRGATRIKRSLCL